MTIADEKIKASSERFMLFKITPKKNIDQDLSLDSGVVYTMSQENRVETIKRNGVELTNVSNTNPSADEWYWDKDSKTLYVGLSSVPNSTDNVVILFFNLYLTGEKTRYLQEDPVTPSGDVVEWEPKISKFPTITESIKNIISGVFTISTISFEVIDTDKSLRGLLDINTTFFNAEVKAWSFVNSEGFLSYVGKVAKIRPTINSLTFTVLDQFSSLNSVASMGDPENEIYARKSVYPDIKDEFTDKPIPYFFGETSFSKIKETLFENQTIYGYLSEMLSIVGGNEAINLGNNNYIIGRTGSGGVADQNVGTITSVGGLAGGLVGYETFMTFETTGHNMKINDTFKVDSADSSLTYFCCVAGLSGSLFSQVEGFYCKVFTSTGEDWWGINGGFSFDDFIAHPVTPASTFYLGKSVQVRAEYNDGISRPIGMNRTSNFVTETTLASGNKLVQLDLSEQNNPKGIKEDSGGNILVPNSVYFTMTCADNPSHELVVEKIIESSGLDVDTAAIVQAGIDLDVDCLFQIPFARSNNFPTYLKVLEKICESTLSMVYINNDLEAAYEVIKAPAANTQEIGDDIGASGKLQVEYQDIFNTIVARNKHYNTVASSRETTGPSVIINSQESKFLNGIDRSKNIEHVLRNPGTRFQEILNLTSKRRITYSFDVAAELTDAKINDDITLSGSILVGNDLTKNAKVFSLKKSPSKITAQAIDLEGL